MRLLRLLVLLVIVGILGILPTSAQENKPVGIQGGMIVFDGNVYDTTTMTGPVLSTKYVPVGGKSEEGYVNLTEETIEFHTAGGDYALMPSLHWVGSAAPQKNKGFLPWYGSADFNDYSLTVSPVGKLHPQINATSLTFNGWTRNFRTDIWLAETSPDGLYVMVILPATSEGISYDGYFRLDLLSLEQNLKSRVEVWSKGEQQMFGGNLDNPGSDPLGVWLEPEHRSMVVMGEWRPVQVSSSPDKMFTAYTKPGGLPYFVFEGARRVAYVWYSTTMPFESNGWTFNGFGWSALAPEVGNFSATVNSQHQWVSCEKMDGYQAPKSPGQCTLLFDRGIMTIQCRDLGNGQLWTKQYPQTIDPTGGMCPQSH